MSYMSRLNRDFQKAPRLELSDASRYILMSDCHRGNRYSQRQFSEKPQHFNTGSCVHPYGITGIEISGRQLSLVKWSQKVRDDMTLYVAREVLAGPISLDSCI